jgi:hypothetical protein
LTERPLRRPAAEPEIQMLVRHTSQYMVSSAINAALGFLSAAVFTRLLTPADYGVYVVGFSMANFIAATIFTWVRYSVMRFEAEGDAVDVRLTSLAGYFVSAATTPILLLSLHFVFHAPWERAGFAVAVALGMSLFDLGQEILRSRLKVRAFVIGAAMRSATAFLVCIGIAELGGGGLGQLGGAALAYFVSAAISARAIWRGPRAKIDWNKLKLFLWLGASVTAAGFLVAFQGALDRLFIAWRFGDVEAGLYGAAADVVKQIILIPAGSVAAAAFPLTVRVFARGDADETRRQLERTGELLFAVLAPAAAGLALTAPYREFPSGDAPGSGDPAWPRHLGRQRRAALAVDVDLRPDRRGLVSARLGNPRRRRGLRPDLEGASPADRVRARAPHRVGLRRDGALRRSLGASPARLFRDRLRRPGAGRRLRLRLGRRHARCLRVSGLCGPRRASRVGAAGAEALGDGRSLEPGGTLPRLFDEALRRRARFLGDLRPGEHARDFLAAVGGAERDDAGRDAVLLADLVLDDLEMGP